MDNTKELERLINKMRPVISGWTPHWIYANMPEWVANGGTALTPLTSTAWDGGDAFSTTAKTLIDLSAVFGVPAGVKAVLIKSQVTDSGSASGIAYLNLSPNNTAGTAPHANKVSGMANSYTNHVSAIVPCNANGDIYYQIGATGSGTMSVLLEIWGYYI